MMKNMRINSEILDYPELTTVESLDDQMIERQKEIRKIERDRASIARRIKELSALSEKLQTQRSIQKSKFEKLKTERKHFFLDVHHTIKKSKIERELSTQSKKRSHQRDLKMSQAVDGEADQCAFVNSKNRRCTKLGRFVRSCGEREVSYCNFHVMEFDDRQLNPKMTSRSM